MMPLSLVAVRGHGSWSPQGRGIPVGGLATPKGESKLSFGLERKGQAECQKARQGGM